MMISPASPREGAREVASQRKIDAPLGASAKVGRMNRKRLTAALLCTAAVTVALATSGVFAADHAEAPGTMADLAADITDVYAWHTENGTLVAVVDFAGLQEAGSTGTYDADVLYTIHIDNDGDNEPDIDVLVRFGQNGAGEWGVQALNVPGSDVPVEGPVGTVIDGGNGVQLFAGPRDDPFFFDLDGYQATLMSGTLMFDSANDTFAGTNVTAIVLEMDAAAASGGSDTIQVWATTGRK